MKKSIITLFALAALSLSLTACGSGAAADKESTSAAEANSETLEEGAEEKDGEETAADGEKVTVKLGLTGVFNEDIWAPAKEKLSAENIDLEFVQFANFSLPNQALVSGDIDMNAFQHHAFLKNEIENNGYDITAIGDFYVVTMAVFSDKVSSLDEIKDGDTIAIPNDATNEGRALKLLEEAGIIKLDPEAGATPSPEDITEYIKKVEFTELDANMIASALPDVTAGVINGNYAVDNGLKAEDALIQEKNFDDDRYFGCIVVNSKDADNETYKKVVEAFQSDETKKVFEDEFAGFFLPAWELDVPEYK